MWELDHNKGWMLKDWCFQTVVLEKTFESSLDSKEIKPVNPKGNQPWIFIGRIDAEAEAPIFRPSDEKSWLIGKHPDDGKDWRQEKKRMTEDEMVGWHHQLNGHEFVQTLRDGEGQGSLACCSPWGPKESDMTEWLNNKVRTSYSLFLLSFIQIKPSFLHSPTFFRCWGYRIKDISFSPCPPLPKLISQGA